jgi:pyruvate dehydrogenase E1 component alpha subunit
MALWSEERPSEDFYRVLAPDGTLVGDPPHLEDDALRELYWTMKLTRAFEDRALRMQRSGELSIISRCRGEEATPLGAAAALSPGDWCFPLYRQRSGLVYWGVPLERQLANLMGAEPETIDDHLVFPAEPDLVIKTGAERLSDFMIWQSVYAELYFTDVNWRDFRRRDYLRAVLDYQNRNRRFGR